VCDEGIREMADKEAKVLSIKSGNIVALNTCFVLYNGMPIFG